MNQFVIDGLVPAWGYAGQKIEDEQRARRVKTLLELHNKKITEEMKVLDSEAERKHAKSVQNRKSVKTGLALKVDPLPPEVVCAVGLWKAMVEDPIAAKQDFNFNQANDVRIKLVGSLNFPPDRTPLRPGLNGMQPGYKDLVKLNAAKAKTGAIEGKPDSRWFLRIDVFAILSVHEDSQVVDTKAEDSPNMQMRVVCEKMDVWSQVEDESHEMQGDPMVESWLPIDSILEYIEGILTDRLQDFLTKSALRESSTHFRINP